jgi:hypothetical protein
MPRIQKHRIYECSLSEAFSLMMEGNHRDDSLFCFCEGLLDLYESLDTDSRWMKLTTSSNFLYQQQKLCLVINVA